VRVPGWAVAGLLAVSVAVGLAGCVRTEKVVVVPSPAQTSKPSPPTPSRSRPQQSGRSRSQQQIPHTAPQPAGTHDCNVLFKESLTYDEVLAYWIRLGSPADMDDDHDGWPCETVYGQQNVPSPSSGTHDCNVLFNDGLPYDEVVAYWVSIGAPSDMDDDHDGWPCETVYGNQN
jgi:hypothetical protein